MSNSFSQLEDWILNSGLVVSDVSHPNYGGVHSFYDESSDGYGFLYPEITGYFLSSLRFLNRIEPDPKYATFSNTSANWLMQIDKKFGGIIQGISSDKSRQNFVYSFDTGICAKGMLDCYELTKNKAYLNFASDQIEWLLSEAIEDDGTINPVKNLLSNSFEIDTKLWYKQKGCLHLKLVMPLLNLYQITGNEKLLDSSRLICENISSLQNDDGSISIHFKSNVVHLHTMCYAMEGLLYAYHITNNSEYVQSVRSGLDWCVNQIQNTGKLLLWYNSRYSASNTCYHLAQVIRLMVLVDSIDRSNRYGSMVQKLKAILLSLQAISENTRVNGGFYEEYFKSFLSWNTRKRVNSWGSLFALQTLFWEARSDSIVFSDEMKFLF